MAGRSIRFEINRKGVTDLLKSDSVRADLEARASRIRDAIDTSGGEEFESSSWIGKDRTGGRAMAMVKTANLEARREVGENPSTLLRALDAGSG